MNIAFVPMHHFVVKYADIAKRSDYCSMTVTCMKKRKNQPIHRVLMKNDIVISWKIHFGENFLHDVLTYLQSLWLI